MRAKVKSAVVFFLVTTCLASLCSCSNYEIIPVKRTEYALGTFISVSVYELSDASNTNYEVNTEQSSQYIETALFAAFERLYEIEKISSAKLPESELSYINDNAFYKEVSVSDDLFGLIKTGWEYSVLTNGAFDITLGRMIDLWSGQKVPDAIERVKANRLCGYKFLELDSNKNSIRFLEDIKLDLGAIAKGWAADEMKRILIEHNVSEAVLDLGGDVSLIGDKNGSLYRVGLADPRNSGEIIGTMRLMNMSAATSGDYERFFIENDIRYHHILDTGTGFPAQSGIISSTIIAENTVIADILATACFVMGSADSFEFLKTLSIDVEAVFITDDGHVLTTEGVLFEEYKN